MQCALWAYGMVWPEEELEMERPKFKLMFWRWYGIKSPVSELRIHMVYVVSFPDIKAIILQVLGKMP
jgi:hypothetical protein